ncbi:TerB family tellurite resistance protein [Gymnodinialimonas sp. 2305UL16-5]|uniref:TerB family tellurite resistance protein n=1 Tax=Gymnodinialimonas mytili TaxID=3126503 RepID=UPI003096D8D6
MVQFLQVRAQVKALAPRPALSEGAARARALLIPSVFVAMANGELQPAEAKEFVAIIADDSLLKAVAAEETDIINLIEALQDQVCYADPEDLISEVIDFLNAEERVKSISYALRIANADGDFDAEEQGTLLGLAKMCGVSPAQINKMLQARSGAVQ